MRRPERQHDQAAHRRPDQHAKVTRRSIQPHRAGQVTRLDDVMQQQLAGRLPQHARHAMYGQQHHGMPHLQGVGDKEIPPAQGGRHEQQHANLDDAARVKTVGQRTGRHREQQERQPVRHHGKTAKRR
ncbi:hypothetical protein D9M73_69430 [compost metagenome]